uniref:Tar RNA binding protein-like protein n=1 Tax=Laodelphax striatellus TaxID=195883 RepID=H6VUG8_LAOST|nr:tar RNA binding protein-like protein [Laodelphax striatellus]
MVYKPNDKKSKKHDHNAAASSAAVGGPTTPLEQGPPPSLMVGPPPAVNNNSIGSPMPDGGPMMDPNLRHGGPIGPPLNQGVPPLQICPPGPTGGAPPQPRMKGPRHAGAQGGTTPEPMPLREAAMMEMKSLQELCMSRRWPPPSYDTEHEEGLPHERQFTIGCQVYKYKEIGTGKSKKLAKRQAANKMWFKLKDMPMENNMQFSFDDGEEMTQRVSNKFSDLKDAKISTLNPQTSLKVSQFHKNLKSSFGIKLNDLQSAVLKVQTFNYVQFLQEIASEQQFEVTYVDIEEKTITGKCQCLVQLSTLPVAVCHGQGGTSKEAQTEAALHALEYLKIMTKK